MEEEMEDPENANVAPLFFFCVRNFNFEKWGDFEIFMRKNLV